MHRVQTVLQDLRYAVRTLVKAPGFSITALAVVALGIGANAAIFSVIDAVLMKPLAYPEPDRLVLLFQATPPGAVYGASAAKFNAVRRQAAIFQDVAAYEYRPTAFNLGAGTPSEEVNGIRVSAGYFRLFGAPLVLGRAFSDEEDRPGGARAAVIGYRLWQRRFGGDPRIAGHAVSLSGVPYVVVGVMGPAFQTELQPEPEVWLPFQIDPAGSDHAQFFSVVARLKPGATVAAANAQLQSASAGFRRQFPRIMGPRDLFAVEPFGESMVSEVRPSLLVLAAAVGLVLLIACANVANLLLARATGRRREIAIRAAIGAGRGRIVRQLLTESLVLSAAGGAVGLAAGLAGVRALLAINPGDIPRLGEHGAAVALDWRLAAFTLSIAILTGLLFGLVPALDVSRADLIMVLKAAGGRSGRGRDQKRTAAWLVAGEMALAVILLVGAALLIRTFAALHTVVPGFDSRNVLTLRMPLTGSRFRTTSAVQQLTGEAIGRLEGLPGVARAAAGYNLPLEGAYGIPFNVVGRAASDDSYDGRGWLAVSPGYFDVFRIPVLRGRAFDRADDAAAPGVAIVNAAFARKFPTAGRVVLGRGYGPEFEEPSRQIVGVVGDVHDSGLNHDPQPMVYVPVGQVAEPLTALLSRVTTIAWTIRTRVPPYPLRASIERELREASGGLSLSQVRTMDEVMAQSLDRQRFNMTLLAVFGCAALALAWIGIYGLMACSVEQCTRELGIRMALGAAPGRLRNSVIAEGMRLAFAGILLGESAAFFLTRFLAAFLFGVGARDALAFVAVPLILGAAALPAIAIPAWRATRIHPASALRCE